MKQRNFKVYRFKTINNTIIYVGYTAKETKERFLEHLKDKYWINEVSEVEECLMENEAHARFIELYYINEFKPIFNSKDKFPGKIFVNLRTEDKKFSHSFYVFNGKVTECVQKTEEDHILVNTFKINDIEVGMYYDSDLNLFFETDKLVKVLDIEKKSESIIKDNPNFIKTSVVYLDKSSSKTKDFILCTFQGAMQLIEASESPSKKGCMSKVMLLRKCSDISFIYQDENELLNKKLELDFALTSLKSNKYNDSDIKRRLIYASLSSGRWISNIVKDYNEKIEIYDMKFPAEVLAGDVFAMTEDLCNEFGLSYRNVFLKFDEFLKRNYDMNIWRIKNAIQRDHNVKEIQVHFIVAMKKDRLYKPFEEFYNKALDEEKI